MNMPNRILRDIPSADWGATMNFAAELIGLAERSAFSGELQKILKMRQLSALFQPIVDLNKGEIFGHEGLIRGPSTSHLHMPLALFEEAALNRLSFEVEHLCRQIVLESFAEKLSRGKLFLNVSPALLMQPNSIQGATLSYIHELGLNPNNVIIELTENTATFDYEILRHATEHYRSMGFEIAIDDLGEGFSSLRLWSELKPDYVKIDKHFISGIHKDQVKLEFVRSIQQIAQSAGTKIVAEGIETQAELALVKELKIDYGQGYLLGRPELEMSTDIANDLKLILNENAIRVYQSSSMLPQHRYNVTKLIKYVPPVDIKTTNEEVYHLFQSSPTLYAVPVVEHDKPVGLISRYSMIDGLARPYRHELYGKKNCETFMDKNPLMVDKDMSLQDLSGLISDMEPHYLSYGFIITDEGKYLGMGSVHDLLREITQLQIKAARHANPLTMLPGNVPISEHMDKLISAKIPFHACYCDLDSFKPFNDVYGFRRGDELIQYVGKLLNDEISNEFDFVGHVGGDDFILILQSPDWEQRCMRILDSIQNAMPGFYDLEDRKRGGIASDDRAGNRVFFPFVSISIGAVKADPNQYGSHHEVSSAIANAKKQAKKISGNSLFIERRSVQSDK